MLLAVSLSYLYDPHRPIPTLGGRNKMIAVGTIDQRRVQALPNYGLTIEVKSSTRI